MSTKEIVLSELSKVFSIQSDQVELVDEAGDNRHFFLRIVSSKFDNLNRLQRSRMVYDLLNKYIQDDSLHALRLELKTPTEAKI